VGPWASAVIAYRSAGALASAKEAKASRGIPLAHEWGSLTFGRERAPSHGQRARREDGWRDRADELGGDHRSLPGERQRERNVEAPRGDLGGDPGAPLPLPQLGLSLLGGSGSDHAA